ncbi:MAG: UDP-2,3-diacylglucosamine diphosphatase [Schleiferiaceae bacterium]|nr:UDP-2,3-diacylglucosamine diphosphatase [Schleiferiaceae bacterium]
MHEMKSKRPLDVCVISDLHLGTYGCHAKQLNSYLKSIEPKTLVLNGDIIDIWNFRKRYFPKDHLKVVRTILKMAAAGVDVHYITGNHDEALRRFSSTVIGKIQLSNKLVLKLDGKKVWIFHGDIFDRSIQGAKILAKIGGWGYDFLILSNRFLNDVLTALGREKYSFSKMVKDRVKQAVKFIGDFEQVAAELAITKGYDAVICGHIHQPQIREVVSTNGSTMYMNSGDWVENLTSLEYIDKKWQLFTFPQSKTLSLDDGDDEVFDHDLLEELTKAV